VSAPKPDWAALLPVIQAAFRDRIPHNAALDVSLVEIGDGMARMRLPYDARLVGNPVTGVLHGGAITSLIDACSGASVFMRLQQQIPIATLDLRIDYMGPAEPGRDVYARAECYRATKHVAFARAIAYHDDESRPIATSASTFMIGTKGRSAIGDAMAERGATKGGK